MPNEKWSAELKESAKAADAAKSVQVVLELNPSAPPPATANRAQRMQAVQNSFAKQAQPIKDKIQTLGGRVTGEAWLNSPIAAEVLAHVLEELERDDVVKYLDVPSPLKRES
jgi:hypothetical protein